MALIRDLLGKLRGPRPDDSDQMELPHEDESGEKVSIRVENLGGVGDVDRIAKLLREGNILFLKTKDLQKRDLGQFQTAVQKLKRVCSNFGYDIAGTEDGYLLVTPGFAEILRD